MRSFFLFLSFSISSIFAQDRIPYSNPMDQLEFYEQHGSQTRTDIRQLSFINVYDPLEPVNRVFFRFNSTLDRYLLKPALNLYRVTVPSFIRKGVANFFQNMQDVPNTLNSLVQLRAKAALRSGARLVLNTTVGILGFFDPADAAGLTYQRNDFGMTLARYGIGAGPYLMLPVLGPSNMRDSFGLAGDILAQDEVNFLRVPEHYYSVPAVFAIYGINYRSEIQFTYEDFDSPFSYDVIRFLYTRKRELQLQSVY
ncbi:VacJ family lipoprotein [Endozoicomonas atrinae]|uniref:MlaA family lipoprotein n=1 Tax=Endozoicomonas atrinae TaxID=1333660 RepID=UPI0009F6D99A|nr:VacJ family lipoprotein [Endozoicomonas atrinae]